MYLWVFFVICRCKKSLQFLQKTEDKCATKGDETMTIDAICGDVSMTRDTICCEGWLDHQDTANPDHLRPIELILQICHLFYTERMFGFLISNPQITKNTQKNIHKIS